MFGEVSWAGRNNDLGDRELRGTFATDPVTAMSTELRQAGSGDEPCGERRLVISVLHGESFACGATADIA